MTPRNPRKAARNRRYYQEKIKPFRKMRPPQVQVRCYFCGMYSRPSGFDAPLEGGIYWKFGPRAQNALAGDDSIRRLAMSYIQDVDKVLMNKSIQFLRHCVNLGYITRKDLAVAFDIKSGQIMENGRLMRSCSVLSSDVIIDSGVVNSPKTLIDPQYLEVIHG